MQWDLGDASRAFFFGTVLAVVVGVACKQREQPVPPSTSGSAVLPSSAKSSGPPCMDDRDKREKGTIRGFSCFLASDYRVDGFECAGGKMLELYLSGRLKGCSLTAPVLLDGWTCQDGVSLYASGKLRRCKVTQPRTLSDGTGVRVGDWITVYEGAGIKRLELARGPSTIQGLPCKGYLNFFHESGRLKKCELAEDALVDGRKVTATSDAGSVFVCLDEEGTRIDCTTLSGMTLE